MQHGFVAAAARRLGARRRRDRRGASTCSRTSATSGAASGTTCGSTRKPASRTSCSCSSTRRCRRAAALEAEPPHGRHADPLWYKDAVIYQAHVRAFFDSNNDGVGDFAGLTQKLDYLQGLGINTPVAAALLPVAAARRRLRHRGLREHPSELRHAGTTSIASSTRRTAAASASSPSWSSTTPRISIRGSRRRGARRPDRPSATSTSGARPTRSTRASGSSSPTPRRRTGRWDDTAKAYYWHRFFHHQPDLNFDNPAVLDAVIKVMQFWLDRGVDGLRLDAVPYLIEREGTICENLEETHEVLKQIRRGARRALSGPHAARRGEPVAGRRAARTSATATSATWRSTSR